MNDRASQTTYQLSYGIRFMAAGIGHDVRSRPLAYRRGPGTLRVAEGGEGFRTAGQWVRGSDHDRNAKR